MWISLEVPPTVALKFPFIFNYETEFCRYSARRQFACQGFSTNQFPFFSKFTEHGRQRAMIFPFDAQNSFSTFFAPPRALLLPFRPTGTLPGAHKSVFHIERWPSVGSPVALFRPASIKRTSTFSPLSHLCCQRVSSNLFEPTMRVHSNYTTQPEFRAPFVASNQDDRLRDLSTCTATTVPLNTERLR